MPDGPYLLLLYYLESRTTHIPFTRYVGVFVTSNGDSFILNGPCLDVQVTFVHHDFAVNS